MLAPGYGVFSKQTNWSVGSKLTSLGFSHLGSSTCSLSQEYTLFLVGFDFLLTEKHHYLGLYGMIDLQIWNPT